MNKNIMCVTMSETTDVGFYDVEYDTKIKNVILQDFQKAISLNNKDVYDLILNLTQSGNIDGIIIDCRGTGLVLVDMLEQDKNFDVPIYKASINRSIMNTSLITIDSYIKGNELIIDEAVDVNIRKFKLTYLNSGQHGLVSLVKTEHDDLFNNLLFLFSFAIECVSSLEENKNKMIVKNNLNEVLDILIDDLSKIDRSNTGRTEELIRLMDKVNYIKSRY